MSRPGVVPRIPRPGLWGRPEAEKNVMRRFAVAVSLVLTLAVSFAYAQERTAALNLKKSMTAARTALDAGRLKEALALYEQVLGSNAADAPRYEADALYGVALSLLTTERTAEQSERARVAAYRLAHATPPYEHHAEVNALLTVLDSEAELKRTVQAGQAAAASAAAAATAAASQQAALRQQADELRTRLGSVNSDVSSARSETDRLRIEVSTLRAESRLAREELTRTRAELAKKDAALRKIAGSIVNKPPR
jgi:hypothetical protein